MEFNFFMMSIGNFYYQYIKFCVKPEQFKMAFRIAEIANKVADNLSQSVNPNLIQLCVKLKMCYAKFLLDQKQVEGAEKILSECLNHCQYEMNLRQQEKKKSARLEMNHKMMIVILYCLATVFHLKEDYQRLLETVSLLEYLHEHFLPNTHPIHKLIKRLISECSTKISYFLKLKGDFQLTLNKILKHDLGILSLIANRSKAEQQLYSQVANNLYSRFNNSYLNKTQTIRRENCSDEVLSKIQHIKKQVHPLQTSQESSLHLESETNDITPQIDDPFSLPPESFMTPMVSIRAIQKHLSNKRNARLKNEDDQNYYLSAMAERSVSKVPASPNNSLNLTQQMGSLFQHRSDDPLLTQGVLLNKITQLKDNDLRKTKMLLQQGRLLRVRNKEKLSDSPQKESAYFKNKSASLKKFQLQLEDQQTQYQKQVQKFKHTFEQDNKVKMDNSSKARFDRVIMRIIEEKKLEKTKLNLASKGFGKSSSQEHGDSLKEFPRNRFNQKGSQQNRVIDYINKESRLKKTIQDIATKRESQRQQEKENPKQAKRKEKRENKRIQQMVQVHLRYNSQDKCALRTEGDTEQDEYQGTEDHALLQQYCLLYMSTFKADQEETPTKTMTQKMATAFSRIN